MSSPRAPDGHGAPAGALTRRGLLAAGAAGVALLWARERLLEGAAPVPVLGFASLPPSSDDRVTLPPGYAQRVLFAWGDPVVAGAPPWDPRARQDEQAQALQAGMHHDGMHLFEHVEQDGRRRWLLAVNHEFHDDGLLVGDPAAPAATRVRKGMAAVGVSVIEVRPSPRGGWEQVPGSPYGRRITADTPMRLAGPAAGAPLLVTGADPTGLAVRGTLANCAAGQTPWGTYLTCEENFPYFFVRSEGQVTPEEKAYGLSRRGLGYGWHEVEPRFDAAREPHEVQRFGWVVEIDPADPASVPVKRTALGRFKHENAGVWTEPGRPVVVYMGDDERFEHLYKFVSEGVFVPGAAANRDLLDRGTLYVARLDPDGTGRWLPLVQGEPGLTAADGFPTQAHVLVFARLAARRLGATPMDRPEWTAVHPRTRRVFVSLTNNDKRGASGAPGADRAHPAAPNRYGHVLALDEDGADPSARSFRYEVAVRGGRQAWVQGATTNDTHPALSSPDGVMVDPRGVLWIQTDAGAERLAQPSHAGFGNNQLLAVDPATLEVRRFLVGPRGCEVTGLVLTPDLRALLVNIQHPGEPSDGSDRSDPAGAHWGSTWPAMDGRTRPRSATVVIWRPDGRPIGA